jgi:nitroreductase
MTPTNQVIDAIRSRRSVRGYQPGPVSREQLELIVDCGRLAPTALNEQRWEFVVVTRHETLVRLAALIPDNGPFVADAMAAIVVCGDPGHRSLYLDGAAATENMLLAIHSLGLASCWVQAMDKPYNPEIRGLLGIPERLALIAIVPVGIAYADSAPQPKRPLAEVLHWEEF